MTPQKRRYQNQDEIYTRQPVYFLDGIPVFLKIDESSNENEYVKNYEKIARDQLKGIEKTGENPFIPEELWIQSENSTRALVQKYSKAGDKILDVGVGMGRLLSPLTSLDRYGIDIVLDFLKIAKDKGINVCHSLIEDMSYKKEVFDIVVCTDVLEYVLDLNLTCQKILSVLRRDGILIVRVPYREDLDSYLDPTYPYKFAHLRNFDEHSLILLFTKIFSCKFVELTYAGYCPMIKKLKYRSQIVLLPRIYEKLIRTTAIISSKLYRFLLKKFYEPIEINMVFKKVDNTK